MNAPEPAARPDDIRALTLAVRRGDVEAFSRFYDVYSFRVYKFLLVLARGDEAEAREVCQTVFIKVARRFQAFDSDARLWAWLSTVARNSYIDHRRTQQAHNRFVSLEQTPAVPDDPDAQSSRLAEIVRETLECLAPEERELIQAAHVDRRPLQELAAESGQTYKAIESRLGRLRHKLKEHYLKKLRHEL